MLIDWFKFGSFFGVPRWVFAALTALSIIEWALGRSKNPRARSLAAMVANVLRFLIIKSRIGSIPVVGGLLVAALEFVAGEDLDGIDEGPTKPDIAPVP